MNTILATLVKFTSAADRNAKSSGGFGGVTSGNARLVRCETPFPFEKYDSRRGEYVTRTTRYIWVSTSCVMGEWETYAFPAYSNGKVHSWFELPGSQRHDFDMADPHDVVLGEMGVKLS